MSEQHKDIKNEAQFVDAYDAYADAVFRFCLLKVRDRNKAIDITQDTFIKTWEYMRGKRNIENIRAFLYRVARNLIIDASRKKKTSSLDLLIEEGIEFGEDQHEREKEIIDAKHFVKRLDDLELHYREVLIMRYIDELSPGEIAYILGEKENTVSVRIHRAIKKAQLLFENEY